MNSLEATRTIAGLMQSQDEVVYRFALWTHLTEVDSGASERSSTDIVRILPFFLAQVFKVRFDGERNDRGRIVCKILLECGLVHCIFKHIGGVRSLPQHLWKIEYCRDYGSV